MPTLFLHMGAGKTGTSALQVAFAQNAERLFESGVLYPESVSNNAAELGKITSGNGAELAKYLNPDLKIPENFNSNAVGRDFDKALRSRKNVLYSSEFFWSFKPDHLKEMVERSAKSDYQTRIVYYIRSIAGHAASVYSQTIKRQKSESSFEQFLIKRYKNPFLSTIERANEAVGSENVLIYNFDAVREKLFAHFLQKILSIDIGSADFVFPKNVNRSLNAFEVEFMRYLNARFEKPYQATFVSDALIYANDEVRPEFTITPSEMKLLESQFSAIVDKLNEYVIGEKVQLCDSSVIQGERPQIQLNDFERSVLSVLARLVPTSPVPEGALTFRALKRLRRVGT